MKKEIIIKIVLFLFIIFAVYLIFEIIRKLTGGSLSFEEIAIGLLAINIGYSFIISAKLENHLGWHKGLKKRKSTTFINNQILL